MRLGDLWPALVVSCGSCKRRGSWGVCSLLRAYGRDASLESVVAHLTRSCPHRKRPSEYVGNVCSSPRCLAQIERPVLPVPHDRRLSGYTGSPFKVDLWDDRGSRIMEEIALASRLTLAVEAFEAAVRLEPKANLTLRKDAQVIRKTVEDRPPDISGNGL